MWYTGDMARTDNLRNVIVVIAEADAASAQWKGRGVEVQTDGTLALGTARTASTKDALLDTLVYGSTPDYTNDDVYQIVFIPRSVLS